MRSSFAIAIVLAALGAGLAACGAHAEAPLGSEVSVGPDTRPATSAVETGAPAPSTWVPASSTASQPVPATNRPVPATNQPVPATNQPVPATNRPVPRFATPERAMRYLAAAYNRNDVAALKQVTNPASRASLIEMRSEAVNLQLDNCSRRAEGDYVCAFTHDFADGRRHDDQNGHAYISVGAADKPGWYMRALIDCD